jgi:hypothetical protein
MPDTDELPVLPIGRNPVTAAEFERLTPAARHRVLAYVHTQLAALEDLPEL